MKRLLLIAIAACNFSVPAYATIFGNDDRAEVFQNPKILQLSRGTAMMISKNHVGPIKDGKFDLDLSDTADVFNACPTMRFAKQPVPYEACTGFLIAPNLLVTAGHCTVTPGERTAEDRVNALCSDFVWLFDFTLDASGNVKTKDVPADHIAHCKRIISAKFVTDQPAGPETAATFHQDYALIELDRPMVDRPVLHLAKPQSSIKPPLMTIGHPLGLPTKYTGKGRVLDNRNQNYFTTQLDILGGNSGGPVLDNKRDVIGIVVRTFPDADFAPDKTKDCFRLNHCDEDGKKCDRLEDTAVTNDRGTHIQRLDPIYEAIKKLGL